MSADIAKSVSLSAWSVSLEDHMTINKSYSVDVADIDSIILACHGCKTALNLPPSDIRQDPPQRCPNCGADWFPDHTSDRKTLNVFLASLRDLRKRSDGKVCQVRLIISQPN